MTPDLVDTLMREHSFTADKASLRRKGWEEIDRDVAAVSRVPWDPGTAMQAANATEPLLAPEPSSSIERTLSRTLSGEPNEAVVKHMQNMAATRGHDEALRQRAFTVEQIQYELHLAWVKQCHRVGTVYRIGTDPGA